MVKAYFSQGQNSLTIKPELLLKYIPRLYGLVGIIRNNKSVYNTTVIYIYINTMK